MQATGDLVKTRYPRHYDIPNLDLLTMLFESKYARAMEDTKIHLDAGDPSRYITKAEARILTKQIAHGLRSHFGVGANGGGKDAVVVISTGQYGLPLIFYGVTAAGGIYSAASPSSTPSELSRQMKEAEPSVLICSSDLRNTAIASAKECNIPLSRVLVLDSIPKISLTSIEGNKPCISSQQLEWERITDLNELEERTICLLYSSGTTGLPKGVCVTQRNFVSETLLPAFLLRTYEAQGGEPYEYRTLAHLPASHVAGVLSYFINGVTSGGETYWMKSFDFIKFLEYNKKYRVTFFFTVPPIFLLIAKSDLVKDHFATLRACVSGAAPMSKELQIAAQKKLGKGECYLGQTWGLSETTGSATMMPWDWRDYTGSVGPVAPGTEIKIVDDDGKTIQSSEKNTGELVVKGPMVCKRYFKNEKATQESFRKDGWFKTGDIGYIKNGLVYVVDRKKELIKYKGLQVAPAELEALLIDHPLIADAAVIGVQGEGTEVPRAYVVADKMKISEQDIKDYVKKNLALHKQLRGGVVYLQAIPKSPSGKILRKDLRELTKKENKAKL